MHHVTSVKLSCLCFHNVILALDRSIAKFSSVYGYREVTELIHKNLSLDSYYPIKLPLLYCPPISLNGTAICAFA